SALVQIAAELKRSIGENCFAGVLADADPTTDGIQADCTVSDHRERPDGSSMEVATIPACTTGGPIPCWRIEHDPTECHYTTTMMKLVVDRGGVVPPSDMFVKASCVTQDSAGQVQ